MKQHALLELEKFERNLIEARAFAVAKYLDNKVAFMAHVDQQLAWVQRRREQLSQTKTVQSGRCLDY